MLKLLLSREVKKFLDTLPPKQFRQIINKIFLLLDNHCPNDSADLKGYPFKRVDIGEYRIIYDIFEKDVLRIILIGKRNDNAVYLSLKHK